MPSFESRVMLAVLGVGVAGSLAASCGSSSPTSATPVHTLPSTVMIMSSGVMPSEISIAVGQSVTFMNHDTVAHSVAGGSEPARPDCPEINAVGLLAPGELRSTGSFATAKTCEYHDPRVQSALFRGRIVIR